MPLVPKKILTLFPGISACVPIQNLGQREGHWLEGGHLLRNYQTIKDINKFTLYPYYSRKREEGELGHLLKGGTCLIYCPRGGCLSGGGSYLTMGIYLKGVLV